MADNIKNKILSRGNWRIIIRPSKFEKEKIGFDNLESIIRNCSISLRGWDYPHIQTKGPYEGTIHGQDYLQSVTDFRRHVEMWRFFQSGLFIHRFAFPEDASSDSNSFWILWNLYRITEIYEFASNLAARDVLGDYLKISVSIYKTVNRYLTFNDPRIELGGYQCTQNELSYAHDFSKADIIGHAHEIALDRAKWIFQRFGWMSKSLLDILKPYQDEFINGKLRS